MNDQQRVLSFWFKELSPEQHFMKDDALDITIKERFEPLYWQLADGISGVWLENAHSRLAAIIVLDQFARNMFRGDPQTFAADLHALECARQMVADGLDMQLTDDERAFCYLPYEHSENIDDQIESVRLFTLLGNDIKQDYAERHFDVIQEFGRFPHRNAVLGRKNTAAEEVYLSKRGAGF